MEPLWSPVVATGGERSQIAQPQDRRKQAESVAVRRDRLRPGPHGKEGVDGSSPSEGLKTPANRPCLLSPAGKEGVNTGGEVARLQDFCRASVAIRRSSAAEAAPRSHVLQLTDSDLRRLRKLTSPRISSGNRWIDCASTDVGETATAPVEESHGIGFVDLGREDRLGQVAERRPSSTGQLWRVAYRSAGLRLRGARGGD